MICTYVNTALYSTYVHIVNDAALVFVVWLLICGILISSFHSVVDLSHNQLDDPKILEVFSAMPQLVCLCVRTCSYVRYMA